MDAIASLKEYAIRRPTFELYGSCVRGLLDSIIKQNGISIHSVSARIKTPESLSGKLSRPGKSYDKLDQVTDLAGLRIITYFHDDVDRVLSLVDQEFVVDNELSVDRRKSDPTVFGYVSVHRICSLTAARLQLPEYRAFNRLKCEIQVRSILQHAWAEIEHDLGYKTAAELPRPLRRRFSKLSALLELGDDEFARLREDLDSYRDQMQDQVVAAPAEVQLNAVTISIFVESNEVFRDVEDEIEVASGAPMVAASTRFLASRVEEMSLVGIRTVGQLQSAISENSPLIHKYAIARLQKGRGLMRGVSVFVLAMILMAKLPKLEDTIAAMNSIPISEPDELAVFVRALIAN